MVGLTSEGESRLLRKKKKLNRQKERSRKEKKEGDCEGLFKET